MREAVPLDGVDVVTVDDFGSGCSSSLRAALTRVDPRADGIVLLLGDQPGVSPATVGRLIAAAPATRSWSADTTTASGTRSG